MPARNTPVRKRRGMPTTNPFARTAKAALEPAPSIAEMKNRRRLFIMSGRLRKALRRVPATKPICTDVVSHAALADESPQSVLRVGTTADALNHRVIPSSSARAKNPRARHWAAEPSTSEDGAPVSGPRPSLFAGASSIAFLSVRGQATGGSPSSPRCLHPRGTGRRFR